MFVVIKKVIHLDGFRWEVQSKDHLSLKMVLVLLKTISLTLVCTSKILVKL